MVIYVYILVHIHIWCGARRTPTPSTRSIEPSIEPSIDRMTDRPIDRSNHRTTRSIDRGGGVWTRLLRTSHDSKIETQTLDATRARRLHRPRRGRRECAARANSFIHQWVDACVDARERWIHRRRRRARTKEGVKVRARRTTMRTRRTTVDPSRIHACIRMDCRVGTSTGRGGDT